MTQHSDGSETLPQERLGSRTGRVDSRSRRFEQLSRVGSWVWNVSSGALTCSDVCRSVLALSSTGAVDLESLRRRCHLDDRAALDRFMEQVASADGALELRYRIVHLTGEHRLVHMSALAERDELGRPVDVVGTIQDITDLARGASELRDSESVYRNLIETTSAVAWELDLSTMRFRYMGPQITAMTGYPPEAWPDFGSWVMRIHEDDRANVLQTLRRETTLGADHTVECRVICADGAVIWIRDVVNLIEEQGEVVAVRGYIHDITEQKRVERALRESQERLRHAQKMESIGRLAGGVAHDFNNLLSVILVNAELALTESNDSDAVLDAAGQIRSAGLRAAELTKQLLAFSRKQMVVPRVVDLSALVDDLRPMLQRMIGAHIILRTSTPTGPAPAFIDPTQVEQVLFNLSVNARDAMPEGGNLDIEVQSLDADGWVQLTVSDSGSGMSDEVQSQMFEPFFTTKEIGIGTGLGLATVQGIVEQNGGVIEVESQLGVGTRFRVRLPWTARQSTPLAPLVLERELRGSEVLLVVEDDDLVRSTTAKLLRRRGFCVLEADSGAQALLMSERYDGHIDLVLTDIVMPHMNGRQLADELMARRPRIGVLFMSGYTNEVIGAEGIIDEELAFIAKPFSSESLVANVRAVLDQRVAAPV